MLVYDEIYNIVEENLQSVNKTFDYYKSTFLKDLSNNPQVVNVSNYLMLDNQEFFQGIFVAAYKRLPEKKELEYWNHKFNIKKKEFQELVLRRITKSGVVAVNQVKFANNPYFIQKMGVRYKLLGSLYGLTDKSFLREFGKKLPIPIQKFIRKVFL